MAMAMKSMSTFLRPKGKNCHDEDLSLNENNSHCFRSERSCFWNNSGNNHHWSKRNCSGSNSTAFKMMFALEWSES